MTPLALAAALALFARPAAAYEFDSALGKELAEEFKKTITAAATGAEVYSRLESAGPAGAAGPPGILLRYDDSGWLARYDGGKNIIYFNARSVKRFFRAGKMKDARLIEKLHRTAEARADFVKRADALYLHELVHAVQRRLYPNYRPAAAAGSPVEFEYEAYLTEDLYCHEKMQKDPALLKSFINGSYYDLYTADTLGAYLTLPLDMEDYRDRIRKKYLDEIAGYSDFERNVAAQKNTVEESRIMAYAAGKVEDYAGDTAALGRLEAEKESYAAFLKDFYGKRWPKFSAEALLFVGGAALEEKNYPLALECLAVADEGAGGRGAPAEELDRLREKGAVAVLEASAFIKDHRKKMPLDILGQHLKALEKACNKTGRPLPEGFAAIRAEVYPKALKYYARRASAEKDPEKKKYYEENVRYFSETFSETSDEAPRQPLQ